LKLKRDELLSKFAINCNVRQYMAATLISAGLTQTESTTVVVKAAKVGRCRFNTQCFNPSLRSLRS